jgi:hypothetical protein
MFDDLIVHEEPAACEPTTDPDADLPQGSATVRELLFEQAILESRRGIIQVSWDVFKQNPLLMVKIQSYVLVMEMSSSIGSATYVIYGISPLFEPVQLGCVIPRYKVVNTTSGDITFEIWQIP